MLRSAARLPLVAILLGGGAAPAPAADDVTGVKVSATITAGQVRSAKPVGSLASTHGTFEEVVDSAGAKGVWELSFSGTTGRVTEARVTYIAKYPTGKVGFNDELCHPCVSPVSGVVHFPRQLDADKFLAAVRQGDAQVVLYTTANPEGEIAGTLTATGSATLPSSPPARSSGPAMAQASASYANGKVTLTLVVGQTATATVIVSDKGKPTFSPAPISLKAGSTTVVLAHHFLTRGYHYGVVNFEFAGSTRTIPISVTVP